MEEPWTDATVPASHTRLHSMRDVFIIVKLQESSPETSYIFYRQTDGCNDLHRIISLRSDEKSPTCLPVLPRQITGPFLS
jgi:hypothetical protein